MTGIIIVVLFVLTTLAMYAINCVRTPLDRADDDKAQKAFLKQWEKERRRQEMKLKNGWQEIGDRKCDFRKGLEHCTIRIVRSSSESMEWLSEITVGYLMVGIMRQQYEADTVKEAMEKAEMIATDRFADLKGFYIRLLRELD